MGIAQAKPTGSKPPTEAHVSASPGVAAAAPLGANLGAGQQVLQTSNDNTSMGDEESMDQRTLVQVTEPQVRGPHELHQYEHRRHHEDRSRAGSQESSETRDHEDGTMNWSNHLVYIGKVDLPHHPVRLRYLPHSAQRYLLYGKHGYQEMAACEPPDFYELQAISWETLICDCVQTDDLSLYMVARCQTSSVIACYDEFMFAQNLVEIRYPRGCLSALATNLDGSYLYGANQELNCVVRFTSHDLELAKAERFGCLWRPFDCCTSQAFDGPADGAGGGSGSGSSSGQVQFLFVSNLDAGISVFNLDTMAVVAECGDDLSPGTKYLAYDPKRSLLFVSCSHDRLLRCYKFEQSPPQSPAPPTLHMVGDFLIANRRRGGEVASTCGPQCVMWDPDMDHLAVVDWSLAKGKFCVRLFSVNI